VENFRAKDEDVISQRQQAVNSSRYEKSVQISERVHRLPSMLYEVYFEATFQAYCTFLATDFIA